jgi:hypothetical protein
MARLRPIDQRMTRQASAKSFGPKPPDRLLENAPDRL